MFCKFVRAYVKKIINFKKKKMKFLTKEEQESPKNAKICYIWQEKFENNTKFDIIVTIPENIEVLQIAYVT